MHEENGRKKKSVSYIYCNMCGHKCDNGETFEKHIKLMKQTNCPTVTFIKCSVDL